MYQTTQPSSILSRTTATAAAAALLAAVALVAGPLAERANAAHTVSVANESEYRDAITAINGDCGTETHTIEITASFDFDIAVETSTSEYTCEADLHIKGAGDDIVITAGEGVGPMPEASLGFVNSTHANAFVILEDLHLSGFAQISGGAVLAEGGIEALGSEFSGNFAGDSGGALASNGNVYVESSVFTDNEADNGGALASTNGTVYVDGTELVGNHAVLQGGAINANGGVSAIDSTFEMNTADFGGGAFYTAADSVIVNATFVGNTATTEGGAIASENASLTILHSTFVDNDAMMSNSILITNDGGDPVLEQGSNVFVGGAGAEQCAVEMVESYTGYADDDSCFTDAAENNIEDGDEPMLEALAYNGGMVRSMRPAQGSPLIDAVSGDFCGTGYSESDVRDVVRAQGAACDIGAVEVFTTFPDVSDTDPTHPFMVEISWMAATGLGEGYDDGTYRPSAPVTRQATQAFVYRMSGEPAFEPPATPTFPDVPTDHPFYLEIEWAAAEGITEGYDDGTFRPTNAVSRQAMAAFLIRLEGEDAYEAPETATFPDVPTDHPFYAVGEAATGQGMHGPGKNISSAYAAAVNIVEPGE